MSLQQRQTPEMHLVLRDEKQAAEAYRTGLKHGMATVQPDETPAEGSPVVIHIDLPFAGQSHGVEGKVVHASGVATVVQLGVIPDGLRATLRQAGTTAAARVRRADAPRPPPGAERPADARRWKTPRGSAALPLPMAAGQTVPGVMVEQGSLREEIPGAVLLRLRAREQSGVLVIDQGSDVYWCFVLKGCPVHLLRDPPIRSVTTEALLLRKSWVSGAVLDRARWLSGVTGRPLVAVVMRLGLIDGEQLQTIRDEQTRLLTQRVLAFRSGRYRFFEAPEIGEVYAPTSLDMVSMVWKRSTLLAGRRPEAALREWLHAHADHRVVWTRDGERLVDCLPLTADQRAALHPGGSSTRTVSSLLGPGAPDEAGLRHLLHALMELGLVELKERTRDATESVAEVVSLHSISERLPRDHFAFLGVHWSALPVELERACDEVTSRVEAAPGDPQAAQIQQRLAEVRERLGDQERRREYRQQIVSEGELLTAVEMVLEQGEMALFRKDHTAAIECFERVRDMEPGGPGAAGRRDRARAGMAKIRRDRTSLDDA